METSSFFCQRASFPSPDNCSFDSSIQASLPHGGIQADSVIAQLESRRGQRIDSPLFARELAFVIEHFGKATAGEAMYTLQLYLRGADNLFLAVSFAERSGSNSSALWDALVGHCTAGIDPSNPGGTADDDDGPPGALFGSLLEAAARCGADLATLVSRIPEGVAIEGLRPKLVAAIADYRLKVRMHEQVDDLLNEDKVSLVRELTNVSRRGARGREATEPRGVGRQRSSDDENGPSPSILESYRSRGRAPTRRHLTIPIR